MPFSGYRDIIQRRDRRLDTRQERRRQWRAVIVDSQGNQSGTGDIWADENARRLWVMPIGGGQPYQVLCVRIGRPVIGLGVIVGYAEGSNTQEVLRDDYEFLGPSNVGISWMSPSDTDFQPGGRMQLWIQTKMIQPLATYPISGLIVGVVGGDYPYGGTRKTYAGTTSQDLTASQPAAGQHLFVGLYLDSSNTLQTVDGTAVAVASTPPEPTWPDGAFRLSVVRIANPQTSITFLSETNPLNDIFDRRMTWSDENSGLSGLVWLIHDQVITIYTTITAAVTASVSGDTIVIPGGTYTETVTVNKSIALVSFEPGNTIITSATNDTTTVTISAANVVLRYLKITNTGAGTANTAVGIVSGATNALIDDCTIEKTSGAAATSNTLKVEAGTTHLIKDCRITAAVGATGYAIHCDTAASTINVQNGRINGTLADIRTNHAIALVILFDPILVNNTVTTTAGTVAGWYTGTTGALLVRPTSGYPGEVWRFATNGFRVKETNIVTAISNAGAGDTIHLYPGLYTVSANIDVNEAVTIVGEDPATTIIKTTTNSLTLVTLSAAGASLRNLTIQNTGAGSGGAGVFWTASSCVIDNCIVEVSGAGTTNYGIGPSGAVTGTVKNCTVTVSGATNNYGFAAVVGNSTTEIIGGKFSGTQFDIYGTIAGAAITVIDPYLANGTSSFAGSVAGKFFDALLVTNASGATALWADAGYINASGDYATTTTANFVGNWGVVVLSGGDTKTCFVANRGRWKVRYAGSAPADGDFLVLSTTGGSAAAQTTMRPEIFARCQAAGASNIVEALLLCNRKEYTYNSSNNLFFISGASDSDFVSTISSISSADLTYGVVSSGNENAIVPQASGELSKIVLWNTTKNPDERALIQAVNTGTNVITVTDAADIAGWSATDAITTRSQTVTDLTNPYYYDMELIDGEIPELATDLTLLFSIRDTGAASQNVRIHPYETGDAAKRETINTVVANVILAEGGPTVTLINRRYALLWDASGAGTMLVQLRLLKINVAAP